MWGAGECWLGKEGVERNSHTKRLTLEPKLRLLLLICRNHKLSGGTKQPTETARRLLLPRLLALLPLLLLGGGSCCWWW